MTILLAFFSEKVFFLIPAPFQGQQMRQSIHGVSFLMGSSWDVDALILRSFDLRDALQCVTSVLWLARF